MSAEVGVGQCSGKAFAYAFLTKGDKVPDMTFFPLPFFLLECRQILQQPSCGHAVKTQGVARLITEIPALMP